ncbi:sigma 54-interacting transcriptional regulator [Desulfosediminicola flagellatus]|uniref:sigma 54-interacting transcriptional regulator n=1 Tax=Desulfosediminicola flagellatus TaxID=2569541 RepID=UPI0010AB6C96|nr:sigma 54-interacting transcriptional regulator [Desulfosediminicola flagellatus]
MTLEKNTDAAILIVDDEVSLRNTFRIFLQRAGYEKVVTVGSFDEGVEAVSSQFFDCIICDIVLERHSGIDLLKRFRELGVKCPVVIITGYPHIETASEAVRLGAFDYLPKPVDKEALLRTTRLAIQQYRLEQGKQEAELSREKYRRFLETLFRSVSDSILSVDLQLRVLNVNQAALNLFSKMQRRVHEGDRLTDLLSGSAMQRLLLQVKEVLASGIELSDHRMECMLEGCCIVLSVCISPLESGTGEMVGCVVVFRDISAEKRCVHSERDRFHRLIGASSVMQNVYLMIENIGRVDTSVLITGASGTGKELVVHALHQQSPRRDKPLVMVDCTTIPDNLMESELFGHKKGAFTGAGENRIGRILQADGGTLFLDEIGDISMTMQLRLLRFLQEKTFYPVGRDKQIHVDVRVIAATNADLAEKVASGKFREDLYYRLLIIEIKLPLLKEREGDIPLLAHAFLNTFSAQMDKRITGISEQAMVLLCNYPWPGNVRQLEHVIERACVLCTGATISLQHLPGEITESSVLLDASEAASRAGAEIPDLRQSPVVICNYTLSRQEQLLMERIVIALKKTGGNKAKAARRLNIDRSTLYRKIRELHIDEEMFTC